MSQYVRISVLIWTRSYIVTYLIDLGHLLLYELLLLIVCEHLQVFEIGLKLSDVALLL